MAGRPLQVFGDGTQSRCFCDVRDVVGALPRLMDDPAHFGRVFNIGSDRSVSIRELAEMVIRELGSKSTIETVPYARAYKAGFEDLGRRVPDLTRIRAAVGFEPTLTLE
jgi:UDP-glucose 4-epimerase